MTKDIPDLPEDDDLLAAEYVLGTLPHAERLMAEARLRRDTVFAQVVAGWQARLSPLNDAYAEAPAPNLLPQIEARLFGQASKKSPFWKSWFAGAAAAAALGVVVLFVLPGPNLPQPLTSLAAEGSALRYNVSLQGDDLRITRVAGDAAGAGLVHEVWLIVGSAAPISLGLIEGEGLSLSTTGLAPGMVLAISLEPTGGSTTGAPTGPVLVTGVVQDI
jgi:anti-sigma-K factor RskA